MISILILLTFVAPSDSLPSSCSCSPPENLSPASVNLDTLSYYKKQENYKEGFVMTLRFLKRDSTNKQLYSWLAQFSYLIGEHSVNNPRYRQKKFGDDNPGLKYGAIQDTAKFIGYNARKNYGPRFWPSGVRRNIGPFALCSHQCLLDVYPQNRNIFKSYANVLIALKKFDKIHEIARTKTFSVKQLNSDLVGDFLLDINKIFIGYGAYSEALKYTKAIHQRFKLPKYMYQKWFNAFNFAIRNDERIRRNHKSLLHQKVINTFPEVDQ